MPPASPGEPWWGTWSLADGELRRWRIGPLSLWVQRLSNEWKLAYRSAADALDTTREVAVPAHSDELKDVEATDRFAGRSGASELSLTPLLADRPVVTRPQAPFSVLPGDDVQVFVSSPVWVRVSLAERTVLCEIPTYRPSDTWFGASTVDGELCYATRTACRLRMEELPQRPHRAVSSVRIRNRGESPLRIDRLNVPVPALSIFAGENASLSTEGLTISHRAEDEDLELEIEPSSPLAPGARPLSEPREPRESNTLARAFSSLF